MKRFVKTAKLLGIRFVLVLACTLLANVPLSYGANCPTGQKACPCCGTCIDNAGTKCSICATKTISITGGGSVDCGEVKTYSVETGSSTFNSFAWEINNDGGTVMQAPVIASPSSKNTDVTVYWCNDNESRSCSWTLKCTATLGTCDFIATTSLSITMPEYAGNVTVNNDADYEETQHSNGKYYVTSCTLTCLSPGPKNVVVPSTSIFFTKIDNHEQKHVDDLNDGSYTILHCSDAVFYNTLLGANLCTPLGGAESSMGLQILVEIQYGKILDDFVDDLEKRAFALSDPIWPQLLYQGSDCGY